MATVYLATQKPLGRRVALKVLSLPTEREESEGMVERFRLEAQALAHLTHPNIVILHDYGETEDARFFLAMEYLDGMPLSERFRQGPMSIEQALPLMLQICAGLRYAHKRGVVHRDLKPSNVMLVIDDDGHERIKLVDFGLVKLTEKGIAITRQGSILGSPQFMAPEQILGETTDLRADIYSFGIILFRAFTGKYPFSAADSRAVLEAHLMQTPPTLAEAAPDLVFPPALEQVVARCLKKSPHERFINVAELMASLHTLLGEEYRSSFTSSASLPSMSHPSMLTSGLRGSLVSRTPVSRSPTSTGGPSSTRSMSNSSLLRSSVSSVRLGSPLPLGPSASTALWGVIGVGTTLCALLGIAATVCLVIAVWAFTHPDLPTVSKPAMTAAGTESVARAEVQPAEPVEHASPAPVSPPPALPPPVVPGAAASAGAAVPGFADAGGPTGAPPSRPPTPAPQPPRAKPVVHHDAPPPSEVGTAEPPPAPQSKGLPSDPEGYFGMPDALKTPK